MKSTIIILILSLFIWLGTAEASILYFLGELNFDKKTINLSIGIEHLEIGDSDLKANLFKLNNSSFLKAKIDIFGPIDFPYINGVMELKNKDNKRLALLNFRGSYPILEVYDSQVFEEGKIHLIDGFLDIREFLKGKISMDDFNLYLLDTKTSNNVILKEKENYFLRLNPKKINKDYDFSFFINDSRNIGHEYLELDYKLKSGRNFKLYFNEYEERIGLEKRIKF